MTEKAKKRFFTWKLARRIALGIFVFGVVCFIALTLWVAALSRDLPSHESLASYEPPITSRVHAGDGTLVAEFAQEHRIFVPYEAIPEHVIQAFVSAEDKRFFRHGGIDFLGVARAAIATANYKFRGVGNIEGGSSITQQVAKNMLLTNERSIERKVREAVIATRMESAFSKEHILELYLNEIYLGGQAYGVGSAALKYFDKSLAELDLSEAAILASLAKAPSDVNPYRRPDRLLERRSYVLGRMVEDGYITEQEAAEADAQPLTTTQRLRGPQYAASTYFVQELRKQLNERYGADVLERGGLSIRTTLDTELQVQAQQALQRGLEAYDRRHGYRGPFAAIDPEGDVREQLQTVDLPGGYGSWEAGMVASIENNRARIILRKGGETALPEAEVRWARGWKRENGSVGLEPGDVVFVEVARTTVDGESDEEAEAQMQREDLEVDSDLDADEAEAAEDEAPEMVPAEEAVLRQIPDVEGAIIVLDPHTGRVLAMVGGYSFYKSPFNRAIQAQRQPGSSFKPFVYTAALESGYTPASRVLDAPFTYYDRGSRTTWRPQNYTAGRSYGEVTMRTALERSFNQVTARIATDVGMDHVADVAERFGIYDDMPEYPAMSLGSGESTPWKMVTAYAAFVNGGKEVTTTIIDRIQDRYGNTIYQHDDRACDGCEAKSWDGEKPPQLADNREQLVDPVISYQIVHMLEGVVERGTATRAQRVGKPLAGKTGTTNDYKDAQFYGFSPDLVVGVWVGFDDHSSLGYGEAGGVVAGEIFTDFMEMALEDEDPVPFRIPPGVRLVSIDRRSGRMTSGTGDNVILEAFQPGTEPGSVFRDESGDFSISGTVSSPRERQPRVIRSIDGEIVRTEEEEDDTVEDDLGGIY